MYKNNVLDNFGASLIALVRDAVYGQFEKISKGEMHSKSSMHLYEKINKLNSSDREGLREIVLDTIDSTIHHFLWLIEQKDELDLVMRVSLSNERMSLKEESDGLCGELYTEEGWIEKFSKYPSSLTKP